MDDMNWGDHRQDHGYQPSGPGDVTQPVTAMPDLKSHFARDRRRAMRWTAGIVTAVVLAGGGAIAGVDLAQRSSAGAAPNGQASVLSTALSAATSDSPGAGGAASAGAGAAAGNGGHAGAGVRARVVAAILRHLRGIHGEFTVRLPKGGFRDLAFERGVIVAVSGTDVTVRAADGTTWTWHLVSNTVVRKDGAKSAAANLATGDPVFVGGPVIGGVRDARLILVPRPRPAAGTSPGPASGSPSPSSS